MDGLKEVLKKVKYILLDMDGTVYLGGRLIGEMDKTLDALERRGKNLSISRIILRRASRIIMTNLKR